MIESFINEDKMIYKDLLEKINEKVKSDGSNIKDVTSGWYGCPPSSSSPPVERFRYNILNRLYKRMRLEIEK